MKNLLLLLFLAPFFSFSQKIENLKAAPEGDKIIITYDLVEGTPGDTYTINIFSSFNNFSSPLHRVSGDVGRGITMGRDKRIEWSSLAELGNFKGELSFEIQVEVVSALTLLTNPPFFKRGKTEPIHWRGGDKKENVKIELVKAGVVVSTIGTVANTGSTEGKIPGNLALGDYQLRLTNAHETVSSQPFPIKRRFPTLVKVIPLVVVAAIVVVVAGGKKGGGSTPPKDPPLARPPYILD